MSNTTNTDVPPVNPGADGWRYMIDGPPPEAGVYLCALTVNNFAVEVYYDPARGGWSISSVHPDPIYAWRALPPLPPPPPTPTLTLSVPSTAVSITPSIPVPAHAGG